MQTTTIAAAVSRPLTPHAERRCYAVLLASGAQDGGKRATLALAAACTAQAMDLDTIVFLIGDGAHWAYDGHAEEIHSPGFPALADLIASFLEAGGQILLCSACDAVCASPADAGGKPLTRRRDVRPRGLASVLSHTVKGGSVTF
jgi:predicted peroxiredoxin